MIFKFARLSMVLPVLLACTVPATQASAQTTGTTKSTTTTTTPTTGTATTQGITGTDPTPIKWPPSAQVNVSVE